MQSNRTVVSKDREICLAWALKATRPRGKGTKGIQMKELLDKNTKRIRFKNKCDYN